MLYFTKIKTLDELKKEFRRLALQNHPDHGGDSRIMREIINQYQMLAKVLPAGPANTEETGNMANSPAPKTSRFYCAYRPTTSGGENSRIVRLASPHYTHKDICTMAKTLFIYGYNKDCDIKAFYWKLCQLIDQGQSRPYCDYYFTPKIAKSCLKFIRNKVLNRIWKKELWKMVKEAENALA